jgi:transposase-like protein
MEHGMESGKKYRRWSWEEKRRAVERMKSCSPQKLAHELGIHKRQLYEWRDQLRRHRGEPPTREEQLKREIEQLRAALGKKVLEVDFLQGALRRIEARRRASNGGGETASTKKCDR